MVSLFACSRNALLECFALGLIPCLPENTTGFWKKKSMDLWLLILISGAAHRSARNNAGYTGTTKGGTQFVFILTVFTVLSCQHLFLFFSERAGERGAEGYAVHSTRLKRNVCVPYFTKTNWNVCMAGVEMPEAFCFCFFIRLPVCIHLGVLEKQNPCYDHQLKSKYILRQRYRGV